MNTAHATLPDQKQKAASDIYFCDSPGELLVLDRKNISKEKRVAIRELHKLNYWYNLKIPFFYALWVLSALLFFNTESILFHIPAWFLMTCSMVGLSILMHESNHNLLFKNRQLNRWAGFICGFPSLVAVSAYRTLHLTHHANTSTEHDPDSMVHNTPKSLPMVVFFYIFLILGAYIYLIHLVITSIKLADARMRRNILVEYALIIAIFTTLFWVLPFYVMLNIWLIPLLIAAQLTNVRGLAEHGLTSSGNVFTDTRTVTSNPFVSFMMNNLNFHLDHHLFPGVPWYNLPKLHAMLGEEYRAAGSSVYPSYSAFLADFFRATWAGYIPDVRIIPKHLREDVCG
jgi:fatty acid desaturase